MIEPVKPFDSSAVEQIVSEGIQLLDEPGVLAHNREGLELLSDAGAKIDWSRSIAHIRDDLVHRSLATVPHEFYLYTLDQKPVVHYGANRVQFDPGSAAVSILDGKTNQHRVPVTKDLVDLVKLVEVLPELDAQSTALVCGDVAEEIGDLYRLYLALCFMNKPVVTGAFRKDTWWVMYELLKTVAGGGEELREKPAAIFDVCPSPPLSWSDLTCQNLIDCARAGIPVQLVSMPMAGATAPVTLAGSVVQHTAENLSGIVIHQVASPGAPIVWGGSPAAFDMRYGSTPMGAPETWLINAGYVQVGKSLNMPTHVYMGMSDAKILDAQCGLESMGGLMVAVSIGANMISGAGMLDFETCQSLEKLVIDAEMIGMMNRVMAGIEIRDQPIALEILREVGHKPEFLRNPHTRQWFKEEFHFPSRLIDRTSLSEWSKRGSQSMADRAHERVEELLNQYQGAVIDFDTRKELQNITMTAAKKFGMLDLPRLPE